MPPRVLPRLDGEELRRSIRLLEAIVKDPALLASVDEKERVALTMAAGRLSRPERLEQRKLARAARVARQRVRKESDRAARAETHIRAARREAVYAAPVQVSVEARKSRARLEEPQSCYVCKAEFRDLHFFYDSMCGSSRGGARSLSPSPNCRGLRS